MRCLVNFAVKMKNLFVIYNTDKVVKEESKDLSPDKFKSDKERDIFKSIKNSGNVQ